VGILLPAGPGDNLGTLELWSRGNRGPIGAERAQLRCWRGSWRPPVRCWRGSTTGEAPDHRRGGRRINDVTGASRVPIGAEGRSSAAGEARGSQRARQ
jgi:hypothetical protein